jgi:hypothetical protein
MSVCRLSLSKCRAPATYVAVRYTQYMVSEPLEAERMVGPNSCSQGGSTLGVITK